MGKLTSTLKINLLDGVSGPARKVNLSLKGVDRQARGMQGRRGGFTGTAASGAAGGLLGMGAIPTGVAAGVVVGAAARKAYTDFAELDRRMTRVGLTADATGQQVQAATIDVQKLSTAVALPTDQVIAGLEALVAQGRSLPEAMSFLPSVALTAQASGAAVEDIAKSAGSLQQQLGISATEMQKAFDVLVAGGKAGQFELKDLAQYLPEIAASAAAVGMKGQDGLKKLVAMLQVVRSQTGDASGAATSMVNIFAKMESEETAKKFQKFGVDLRDGMAVARREGKDLIEVFLDMSEQALKGDLSKIPQLFSDMEFARGMRALLLQRKQVGVLMDQLGNANGATAADMKRVAGDAQAAVDRLSNSWDKAWTSMGRALDSAGATSMLEDVATRLDRVSTMLTHASESFGGVMKVLNPQTAVPFTDSDPIKKWLANPKLNPGGDLKKRVADTVADPKLDFRAKALNVNRMIEAFRKERDEGLQSIEGETAARVAAASAEIAKLQAGKFPELVAGQVQALRNEVAALTSNLEKARAEVAAGLPAEPMKVPPRKDRVRTERYGYEEPIPVPRRKPAYVAPLPDERPAQKLARKRPFALPKPVSPNQQVFPAPAAPTGPRSVRTTAEPDTGGLPQLKTPYQNLPHGEAGSTLRTPGESQSVDALSQSLAAAGAEARSLGITLDAVFGGKDFSAAGAQAAQSFKSALENGMNDAISSARSKMAELKAIVSQPLRGSVRFDVTETAGGRRIDGDYVRRADHASMIR